MGASKRKNIGKKGPATARDKHSAETVQLTERKQPEDYKYLEREEITVLFKVMESKRDRALFRVIYHRGLRAHEPGLLQMADFREKDGVLFVHRGKGSISREHSLVDEELKCLRAWVKERGTYPGPLFPSRQGSAGITRSRLHQLMRRYCKLAKIPLEKAHCHALKHSCGTHLAERKASGTEIQHWLGHRDPSSTDIYLHFSRKRENELAEKHRNWA